MSFYDKSGMDAIKINVLSSGIINVCLFKDNDNLSFKTYQEKITEKESLELVVLMYNIVGKNELYGKAINDMDSNIEITREMYDEFQNLFNEKDKI